MTNRARSSKHAPSSQRMRGSQSSKPRHLPDVPGLPFGTAAPMEQESSFLERNYVLSSAHPEYLSQGPVQELHWSLTGYGNSSEADLSLAYSGGHGEFPSYDTCMEENGHYPRSYNASVEAPVLCPNNVQWTLTDVDTSMYSSMDCDFDMLSGNALSQSSSGLFTLSTEVEMLPARQSSDAMYSAHTRIPNGTYCHGTLPGGIRASTSNIHAVQRTAVEAFPQPWTHGQQFPGMAQQMPLTPPASDHGTPPGMQDCPSLSPQDPGQHAYNRHRRETRRTGDLIESVDDSYPRDTTRWNQIQSNTNKKPVLAQRPIRSALDRRGSHDSEESQPFQPEGNHTSDAQPRSHPFYQNSKGEDGKWHCPFKEETNCNHEPTLQKCGFDKYLDSHLKPFVCTHHDCGSPRFSSNACLFRHQREAHGQHGHGENPHLCRYPGCERAQEKNGFPRKWNLKDHMKRVHGWEESEDSLSSDSPPGLSHKSGQTIRKRKSPPPVASVPMKRQSSSQTKARAASISFLQQSHPQEYAVGQSSPPTWKRADSKAPSFPGIFQDTQSRINGYPPHFGHTQNFYSQYPF